MQPLRSCLLVLLFAFLVPNLSAGNRPNVILVISDDQGIGDLGLHGNERIKTPHLDKFGREGIRLSRFYVSPVCAPTRAALMTGRFQYRTGVIHTSRGGAKMHGDEITMAELLGQGGYRTGLFGKWHLGDNYPMRPQDQGFQEVLMHKSGGITQPPDQPGSYFDPVLWRNGKRVQGKGYCTDVFFDAALEFIGTKSDRPFFAFIPLNAPHTPLQIGEEYVEPYRKMGLDDTTAKVYGMVQNLDENFGRLIAHLEKLKLRDNTVVIFMTDNGPQQQRYTMNLRGRKSMTYEGGIRVPCLVQWPARWKGGRIVDRLSADMDWVPTLLEVCEVRPVNRPGMDGMNLEPLLAGTKAVELPDRNLFFQVHRGLTPHPYQNMAVVNQRWKLVGGPGAFNKEENVSAGNPPVLELYDLLADPAEEKNLAAAHPDQLKRMKEAYEAWFAGVKSTRGFKPGSIHIGNPAENPVHLCQYQDGTWSGKDFQGWQVVVERSAKYRITAQREVLPSGAVMNVTWQTKTTKLPVTSRQAIFELSEGTGQLEIWLEDAAGQRLPVEAGGIQGDVSVEKL